MSLEVQVAGETLVLFPERAAWWPGACTLLVADPHFGKAATFRSLGVPVPRGTTADALERLDALLRRVEVRRVLFLGDFLHARRGRSERTLGAVAHWRAAHSDIAMTIVRGNHDREAGDVPGIGIAGVDALVEGPFVFAHVPALDQDGYVIAGHLHPGADLVGAGRQHVRLPCFWFGSRTAVLPAFGDFTGLWPVSPDRGDRVFVIAEGEIVERAAR
ncbi:MAG TPA: ligase-associated DNA damage response endonuclease PdeM [Gemmatimonadaceae bacterium]|nr:ligase-associated DNA damage response endonuclease PdeM [Gemmatimonadaceae bacterium]